MANQQKIKQTETEIYRHEGRRWPALILLLVAALVIATAVTLVGRWLYREISGSEENATETTSDTADFDNSGASKSAPAETAEPSETGSNNGNSGSTGSSSGQNQDSDTMPATGDEDLPSTGG